MQKHIKSVLKGYPVLYKVVRATYRAVALGRHELSTLRRMGPSLFMRPIVGIGKSWRRALPVQSAIQRSIAWPEGVQDPSGLVAWAESRMLSISSGRHSIYLSPKTWHASSLAEIANHYPSGCGLKISREPGGVQSPYVISRSGHNLQRRYSMTHRQQALIFNFLHLKGIAPRLYDVLELQAPDGLRWAAYVVEHVEGSAPGEPEYQRIVGSLREQEANGVLRLVTPGGWDGTDFQKFGCNGNLIRRHDGSAYYVDVHSFVLHRYEKHLLEMANRAAAVSHFGGKSFILGGTSGKYLYQSIPGVPMPAKRSPGERMCLWDHLLMEAGVTLRDKVVFDVGCNLGLMSAEYLRRGSRWVHGWDMPRTIEATRQVLLSTGCTRFSLTPCELSASLNLIADVPEHVSGIKMQAGIVSYLAMRQHISWLPGLSALPWQFMLYEGHQGDRPFQVYLDDLAKIVDVRVLGFRRVSDANSAEREMALVERIIPSSVGGQR